MRRHVVFVMGGICFFSLIMSASAETVSLKSGEQYEGQILERADDYIRLDVGSETLTFNWNDIKSISRRVVPKGDQDPSDGAVADASKPDTRDQERASAREEAAKEAEVTPSSNPEPPGYNGIIWGQAPGEFSFLKYVFTDPATGVNIYIDQKDPSEKGRDWKERTQYHFWKDQFFKMTHKIPNKKAWQYLKDTYTRQYGSQENNKDNPNIYIWEGDKAMIAINFDDDYQEGTFVMAAKNMKESINAQDSGALASLLDALDDTDNEVRTRAVLNLGVMKDSQATLSLIPLLRDKNFIVRYNTAYALGEIKDERAVPSLIAALEDEDDFVRSFAAEALGKIGSQDAVVPLIKALEENDAAITALQQITGKDFGQDQYGWKNWWKNTRSTSL